MDSFSGKKLMALNLLKDILLCKVVYEGGLAGLSAVDYIRGMKNHV